MIQEADVGVGIMGKEGSHAAMSADYVLMRFAHLVRLLFIHGRYSHFRSSKVVFFSFYKNMAFPFTQFWFAFFSLGAGQTLYEPNLQSGFNLFFTALPPFVAGFFEKDVIESVLLRTPWSYDRFKRETIFTNRHFFWWMATAIWQSIVLYYLMDILFSTSLDVAFSDGTAGGLWVMGNTMAMAMIFLTNFQMIGSSTTLTWVNAAAFVLGIAAFFLVFGVLSASYWITLAPDCYDIIYRVFGSAICMLYIPLAWFLAALPRFLAHAVNRLYWPNTMQQLQDIGQALHRLPRGSIALSPDVTLIDSVHATKLES